MPQQGSVSKLVIQPSAWLQVASKIACETYPDLFQALCRRFMEEGHFECRKAFAVLPRVHDLNLPSSYCLMCCEDDVATASLLLNCAGVQKQVFPTLGRTYPVSLWSFSVLLAFGKNIEVRLTDFISLLDLKCRLLRRSSCAFCSVRKTYNIRLSRGWESGLVCARIEQADKGDSFLFRAGCEACVVHRVGNYLVLFRMHHTFVSLSGLP